MFDHARAREGHLKSKRQAAADDAMINEDLGSSRHASANIMLRIRNDSGPTMSVSKSSPDAMAACCLLLVVQAVVKAKLYL